MPHRAAEGLRLAKAWLEEPVLERGRPSAYDERKRPGAGTAIPSCSAPMGTSRQPRIQEGGIFIYPDVRIAVAELRSYKRCVESVLLNRMAHADVFEIGSAQRFLFVLFGGSGVDEEEYQQRSKTIIPVFRPVLQRLAEARATLVMVYASAPYDVPFNRFSTERSSAQIWNAHVLTELLEPWSRLPYFVSGFSGGAALALNGLEKDHKCFGGAAFGADALPPDFVCPAHWPEKLRLYSAPHDLVCNHPVNRQVAETLESRGQAERFQLRSGGHQLADYATGDGLTEVIRFADSIVPKS